MRALICYCYQGFLDDATKDGEGAVEIFKLADKYCIDNLKAALEGHFTDKRLSVENVIEMAKLADAHSAGKLMEVGAVLSAWIRVVDFITTDRIFPSRPVSSSSSGSGRPSTAARAMGDQVLPVLRQCGFLRLQHRG